MVQPPERNCSSRSDERIFDSVRHAICDNTKPILTETPANPTLKLGDIAAISSIANERSILHAADNTFLTPCWRRSANARSQRSKPAVSAQ
jgi:cystathionine beta-lyase/cystathionine gamma-synthase